MVWGFYVHLYFAPEFLLGYFYILAGSLSEDQLVFDRKCWLCAYMIYFGLVMIAEIIKAQAVFFFVDLIGKLLFQHSELRGIDDTLKDGILHSDAVVYTLFCDAS